MTLLISVFAAIISTAVWYFCAERKKYLLNVPCYIFWGASVMWFVDAVFEYSELKAAYFTPAPEDMLNDAFLGFSIIALGLIVWIIILLIKDPNNVIRDALFSKKNNASLSFVHPITGEPLNFHAPLPEDMQNLLT